MQAQRQNEPQLGDTSKRSPKFSNANANSAIQGCMANFWPSLHYVWA